MLNTTNKHLVTAVPRMTNDELHLVLGIASTGLMGFRGWDKSSKAATLVSTNTGDVLKAVLDASKVEVDQRTLECALSSAPQTQSAKFSSSLRLRQGNICALEGCIPLRPHEAHIIPFSITQNTPDNIAAWNFFSLFLGTELFKGLFEHAFHGDGVNSARNGILMGGSYHDLFDTGLLSLQPFCSNSPEKPYYPVRVIYRGRLGSSLESHLLKYHEGQVETPSRTQGMLRCSTKSAQLRSGDTIHLATMDSIQWELPSKSALLIREILWRTIADAGLSETATVKGLRFDRDAEIGSAIIQAAPLIGEPYQVPDEDNDEAYDLDFRSDPTLTVEYYWNHVLSQKQRDSIINPFNGPLRDP